MVRLLALVALALCLPLALARDPSLPKLGRERLVFQTSHGDIHMGFFPEVAPKAAEHIRRLGEMGGYNTNHFFRVDRGFVAQTADVPGGRTAPMNPEQRALAAKTLPLEVVASAKHDRRGVLSMARHSDPNSGGSSFSVLLGPAPHLDMQYSVFGEVTKGLETLDRFERVETVREGIFVMPKERITILSTYSYVVEEEGSEQQALCSDSLADLSLRFNAQAAQVEKIRQQRLPGN